MVTTASLPIRARIFQPYRAHVLDSVVTKTIKVPKPGKHGKLVLLPIHDDLLHHLEVLASTDRTDDYVMPTLACADPGGKGGLSLQFKAIARKAGVDVREITRSNGHKFCRRSFHSLRHGLVSGLANKGVPSEQGRAITGHKTESNYAHYRHFEIETLRKAINKMPSIPE